MNEKTSQPRDSRKSQPARSAPGEGESRGNPNADYRIVEYQQNWETVRQIHKHLWIVLIGSIIVFGTVLGVFHGADLIDRTFWFLIVLVTIAAIWIIWERWNLFLHDSYERLREIEKDLGLESLRHYSRPPSWPWCERFLRFPGCGRWTVRIWFSALAALLVLWFFCRLAASSPQVPIRTIVPTHLQMEWQPIESAPKE